MVGLRSSGCPARPNTGCRHRAGLPSNEEREVSNPRAWVAHAERGESSQGHGTTQRFASQGEWPDVPPVDGVNPVSRISAVTFSSQDGIPSSRYTAVRCRQVLLHLVAPTRASISLLEVGVAMRGKLHWRTGKHEQAQERLMIATRMYREMDMRFWLEQAEAEKSTLA